MRYLKALGEGIAKIVINRPERRNAFTPRTVREMSWCFADARDDSAVGVVARRAPLQRRPAAPSRHALLRPRAAAAAADVQADVRWTDRC